MNLNESWLVSVPHKPHANACIVSSWQMRLGCQVTAAALILAMLPLLSLITAALSLTSKKPVFVRRMRWLGGRERVAVLEYRDNRFLEKTGLIVLPMLFEVSVGKHVLSREEVSVFLRGVRRVFQFKR